MTQRERPTLAPRLIVHGADAAIAFYREAFGAELIERYEMAGAVVHAALRIRGSVFSLAEANAAWAMSPPSKDIASHLLTLTVDDPDATCAKAVALGAEVMIPIADRPYGHREGRLADPFGHLWILSKVIEELSEDEINRRLNA